MSKIYTTTYEVIGAGIPIAEAHFEAVEAAQAVQWEFVESVGGVGFRPNSEGALLSVYFTEVPQGWRKIGSQGHKIETRPNKSTVAGKAAAKLIADLPHPPRATDLASQFGYNPSEWAIDRERGVIYFPTMMQVAHPEPRSFLRLPRFSGDGFEPDETILRALAESELMKAVEDHNAEAKRQREAKAA